MVWSVREGLKAKQEMSKYQVVMVSSAGPEKKEEINLSVGD